MALAANLIAFLLCHYEMDLPPLGSALIRLPELAPVAERRIVRQSYPLVALRRAPSGFFVTAQAYKIRLDRGAAVLAVNPFRVVRVKRVAIAAKIQFLPPVTDKTVRVIALQFGQRGDIGAARLLPS